MKFIIDAQLPFKLSSWLKKEGYDVIHTSDLPDKNLTPDKLIIKIAEEQDRVVITKDSDFFENYILHGEPKKLILITTGNIINKELINLFQNNMETLVSLIEKNQVVELNFEEIIVHY